jgi:hypothetical protein
MAAVLIPVQEMEPGGPGRRELREVVPLAAAWGSEGRAVAGGDSGSHSADSNTVGGGKLRDPVREN